MQKHDQDFLAAATRKSDLGVSPIMSAGKGCGDQMKNDTGEEVKIVEDAEIEGIASRKETRSHCRGAMQKWHSFLNQCHRVEV